MAAAAQLQPPVQVQAPPLLLLQWLPAAQQLPASAPVWAVALLLHCRPLGSLAQYLHDAVYHMLEVDCHSKFLNSEVHACN